MAVSAAVPSPDLLLSLEGRAHGLRDRLSLAPRIAWGSRTGDAPLPTMWQPSERRGRAGAPFDRGRDAWTDADSAAAAAWAARAAAPPPIAAGDGDKAPTDPWEPPEPAAEPGGVMAALQAAEAGAIEGPSFERGRRLPVRFQVGLRARYAQSNPRMGPPPEHGDVQDAPARVQANAIRAEVEQQARRGWRVLVLFCGGGGATHAFLRDGVSEVVGVDFAKSAEAVHRANFPAAKYISCDLSDVAAATKALKTAGKFDVVTWSSPCPDFSLSGAGREGPSARLTVAAARLIVALGIPVALFENVPQVVKSTAWRDALKIFAVAGFATAGACVRAEDYGVPQFRSRFFALSVRGASVPTVGQFVATLEARRRNRCEGREHPPRVTIAEALPGRARCGFLHPRGNTSPAVFSTVAVSGRKGREWSGLAPALRTACGHFPRVGVYEPRLRDVAPLTRNARFSRSELGVLQGFPKGFLWPGSRTAVARVVGNAVPPPMMHEVWQAALESGAVHNKLG